MTPYSSTSIKFAATLVLLVSGLVASCRDNATSFTVEMGKVVRVEGCHVKLELVRTYKDDSPLGDFNFACKVSESALNEKNWWGDQPQPLMFSLLVGDCLRLEKTWYCVEAIEPGKSATLKATFKTVDSDTTVIDRIR